jgi:hypothetical protein
MSVDLWIRTRARPWPACSLLLVDQTAKDLAAFDPALRLPKMSPVQVKAVRARSFRLIM